MDSFIDLCIDWLDALRKGMFWCSFGSSRPSLLEPRFVVCKVFGPCYLVLGKGPLDQVHGLLVILFLFLYSSSIPKCPQF